MPRRIDVELTSARDDGTWTWRAAGAREPKGVISSTMLYAGAKVGDVVKAEADFDIDGITITSIAPPKAKAQAANLIEVTGPGVAFEPVTTSLAPRREGGPGRDRDDRDRRPRPGGDRGPRPQGDRGPRPPGDRGARPSADRGPRPQGDRGPRPPGDRRDRPPVEGDRSSRPASGGEGRPPRPPRGDGPDPAGRRDRPVRPSARTEAPTKPRPKRLSPANTHRLAVLEALSPEQRPVAEQVLRGGIPAVRRAIQEQNTQARAEGLPEVKAEALVGLAEDLLPRLKTAEWHDRADAALADIDSIGLRDLRSVVTGADAAARDDETRVLAVSLREALQLRLKRELDEWLAEIATTLDDGRLVRALRLAARGPDPAMRLPAELALRISAAASEAMTADTPPDRWMALLEAVVASPVRTSVKPASLPSEPGEALLHAARQQAGRVPALAALLGISMPPPPGPPRRMAHPTGAGAPAPPRARPIPPPPPRPAPPED